MDALQIEQKGNRTRKKVKTLDLSMATLPVRKSWRTLFTLRLQRRCISSGVDIPKPTWSVGDLDLTSKKAPLPREELKRLSRLSLIDIDSMPERESLEQDLANMIHMIDQVSDFASNHDDFDQEDDVKSAARAAKIYDNVRGVSSAPLRLSIKDDPLQVEDQQQAKNVWNSLLKPKTTRVGGRHEYFVIKTKEQSD